MVKNFYEELEKIISQDRRFKTEAYEFVLEALHYTQKKLSRQGHVTGRELVEGLRDYALEQFGGMARYVFKKWGIEKTQDFGDIVFNMIERSLLHKREEDSREDFKDVYNFAVFDIKLNIKLEQDSL
jgi:uncharacterized repeat protein (TIGR04138 family)